MESDKLDRYTKDVEITNLQFLMTTFGIKLEPVLELEFKYYIIGTGVFCIIKLI